MDWAIYCACARKISCLCQQITKASDGIVLENLATISALRSRFRRPEPSMAFKWPWKTSTPKPTLCWLSSTSKIQLRKTMSSMPLPQCQQFRRKRSGQSNGWIRNAALQNASWPLPRWRECSSVDHFAPSTGWREGPHARALLLERVDLKRWGSSCWLCMFDLWPPAEQASWRSCS